MELSTREKLDQLEILLQSRTFQGSDSLRAFLKFVVTRTVKGENQSLKEYVIASEVFGQSNYDPRVDSIVRVQAGRLRSKLQEYYATEGRRDPVRIELPKGNYTPTFSQIDSKEERTSDTVEAITPVQPVYEEPLAQAKSRVQFKVIAIASVLIVACISLLFLINSYRSQARVLQPDRKSSEIGSEFNLFWGNILKSSEPTLISFSNTLFEIGEDDRLGYAVPFSHTQSGAPNVNGLQVKRNADVIDYYTGVGEVMGVAVLTGFFGKVDHDYRIKRSLLLDWDDLKTDNIVILGSPQENLLLRKLPQRQNLVFSHDQQSGLLVVRNLLAKEGEQEKFIPVFDRGAKEGPATKAVVEDYATVSSLRGLGERNRLIALAGITTFGTQAAAEYVTRPEYLKDLVTHLNQSNLPGKVSIPDHFQILLKVTINGGVPVQISYVTHHVIN
jgi:hypothetical protein